MRIERVSYQKVFPLGMYINEKIGVELILNEGEDAMEALAEARKVTHDFFDKNNPEPFVSGVKTILEEPTGDVVIVPKLSSKEKQRLSLINSINSCDKISDLESYKLISKSNPELQTIYDNKLNELNE